MRISDWSSDVCSSDLAVCNNYRWDYTPDEYQLILKLGVWLKGEILRETSIGKQAAEKFVKKQASVAKRSRPSPSRPEAQHCVQAEIASLRQHHGDRKSVVSVKRVSVSGDSGSRSFIKTY